MFKKGFVRAKGLLGVFMAAVAGVFLASPAYATLDLTGVAVDVAPVFTLAGIIIAAIAAIWAIKKVIKLGNRS